MRQKIVIQNRMMAYFSPGGTFVLCYAAARQLKKLIAPWIACQKKLIIPDFTTVWNIENLQCLELSHYKITDPLFKQIPVKFPVFKVFSPPGLSGNCSGSLHEPPLQDTWPLEDVKCCRKQESSLPKRCDWLNIRGHHLTETQFWHITREHPDALERVFEDFDDYVHMLPV